MIVIVCIVQIRQHARNAKVDIICTELITVAMFNVLMDTGKALNKNYAHFVLRAVKHAIR